MGAGGRFLYDVTEGTLADGPYWRMGVLGYSTMDERYEWVMSMSSTRTIRTSAMGRGRTLVASHNHDAADFGSRRSGSTTFNVGASSVFQRQIATQVPPGDMTDG